MSKAGMGSARRNNTRNRILHIIRNRGQVSKVEIKRISKYSMVTVLDTIEALHAEGLIHPLAKESGRKLKSGRRPTNIALNPGGAYFLGLSFHAAELSVALLDFCGGVLEFARQALEPEQILGPRLRDTLAAALEAVLERHAPLRGLVMGIGVGAPGFVDAAAGTMSYPPADPRQSLPLAALLGQRFPGIPVYVENNVNAMLLAYRWFLPGGPGDGAAALISIRSGVRMGCMIGSDLYKGQDQTAGMIGHIKVPGGSRYCSCGKRGCLESEVSERALRQKLLEGIEANRFAGLWEAAGRDLHRVDIDLFIRAAQAGDADALGLLDETCLYLGEVLGQVVNILNPTRIIFNTRLCDLGELFFDRLKAVLRERSIGRTLENLSLEPMVYGEQTAAMGAAAVVLEREMDFVDALI
jgi:predicted NBD/HSP70 family sugar kinase